MNRDGRIRRLAPAMPALAAAACLAPAWFGALAAQEREGPGDVVASVARSIRLEGQLQFQASTTSVDEATDVDLDLRRIRLAATGRLAEGFTGVLQAEFESARARVRDAYLDVEVSPALGLRVGQFKIPFNGIETVSSKRLLLIERGARIRGVDALTTSAFLVSSRLSARHRGVQGTLAPGAGRVTLQAGAWTGSGEGSEDDDGKMAAARLEVRLLPAVEDEGIPLVVGLAGVTNGFFGEPGDTLVVSGADTALLEDPSYAAAGELWLELGEYGAPGLHVQVNALAGENPLDPEVVGPEEVDLPSFLGLQLWTEWLVERPEGALSAWGPAFRLDRFDPDTDAADDALILVTPGLNLYFGPALRVQVDYDVLVPESEGETESAFRTQAQLLF
jgi:hypothetical protein